MMRNRVSISSAILVSFVLHVLLLVAIEPDFKAPALQHRESVVFTLLPHLAPQKKVVFVQEPLLLSDSQPEVSQEPLIAAPNISTAQLAKSKAVIPMIKSVAQDALVSSSKSIDSLISTREVEAFENFSNPKCDDPQRASLAKPCVVEEQASIGADPQLLGQLFRDLSLSSPNFERDMDSVERLLEQAENLQALVSLDPVQVAVVEEQRRHIRQEILRIDSAHQQANLLRLIPQAARIVRGLNERHSSSK